MTDAALPIDSDKDALGIVWKVFLRAFEYNWDYRNW